jgi:hypothetical protein
VPLQPAGFQYIMRYSAHSAGITALALATKLKLAAVADASGRLSLLDLLQPAQLFSTRALAQPVTQAVFGSHVVPGPTKEDLAVERWAPCSTWSGACVASAAAARSCCGTLQCAGAWHCPPGPTLALAGPAA